MKNYASESITLEPISKEHLEVLKLCENIRTGLQNRVEKERIRSYTDWFKEHYLDPHFELEEQHIFPLLGNNVRVKKAMANHRRIHKLLSCDCDNERVLNLLEEELSAYIRFEEKILYKELAKKLSPEELTFLEEKHENFTVLEDEWQDKFWLP